MKNQPKDRYLNRVYLIKGLERRQHKQLISFKCNGNLSDTVALRKLINHQIYTEQELKKLYFNESKLTGEIERLNNVIKSYQEIFKLMSKAIGAEI